MKAIQRYHSRRWVVKGALGILQSQAGLTYELRDLIELIESKFKEANWNQYQAEKVAKRKSK